MKVVQVPAEISWKVTRQELNHYLTNNEEMPDYVQSQNHICAVHAVTPDYVGGLIFTCTDCNNLYDTGPIELSHIVLLYHEYSKVLARDECWCWLCKKSTFSVFGPGQGPGCPWCPPEFWLH